MAASIELFKRREDFVGMAINLDLRKDLFDHTIASDNERGALDAHELASVKRLLLVHSVGFGHGVARVAQQREVERLFRDKLLVRGGGIGADADDLRAE